MKAVVGIVLTVACAWLCVSGLPPSREPVHLAGVCVGADPCGACVSCRSCKHCRGGGTCGACKEKKKGDGEGKALMAYFAEPLCR